MKYLSTSEEEELIKGSREKSSFPEDNDELFDFLGRFNSRSLVNESNVRKILVEIAKQELIQKPHVMLATCMAAFGLTGIEILSTVSRLLSSSKAL